MNVTDPLPRVKWGVSAVFEGRDEPVEGLLTEVEIEELSKIRAEPGVVGYLLFRDDGVQLAAENVVNDDLVPIFANAFDLADAIGGDLGETGGAPAIYFESAAYEIAALRLSSCNAVIVRQKPKGLSGGFNA